MPAPRCFSTYRLSSHVCVLFFPAFFSPMCAGGGVGRCVLCDVAVVCVLLFCGVERGAGGYCCCCAQLGVGKHQKLGSRIAVLLKGKHGSRKKQQYADGGCG